jgi:hypothetical protein
MTPHIRAWITLLVALLCGCAQINWERGLYEGMRQGTQREATRAGPEAVRDPQLPDYDGYEKERRRAQRPE